MFVHSPACWFSVNALSSLGAVQVPLMGSLQPGCCAGSSTVCARGQRTSGSQNGQGCLGLGELVLKRSSKGCSLAVES